MTGSISEKRKVGEWFGPNTMAQVMKKICHDKSLGVSVHVAMDSGIENKYNTIFRYHFDGAVPSGNFTFVTIAINLTLKSGLGLGFFTTVTKVE